MKNVLMIVSRMLMLVGVLLVVGSADPDPSLSFWTTVAIAIVGFLALWGGYQIHIRGGGDRLDLPWKQSR